MKKIFKNFEDVTAFESLFEEYEKKFKYSINEDELA